MDHNGSAGLRERLGPWRGDGDARFLALVVALALGLSASESWSQDVFSAGSGSAAPGPSGASSGSDQFSGAGVETTSVVRGSQQVLRRCKLKADYSGVICDDGYGEYGPALIASNPRRIPQPQADELERRERALQRDPRVQLGNAYARARGLREVEFGPQKTAIGSLPKNRTSTTGKGAKHIPLPSKGSSRGKGGNTTKRTQRGAIQIALPTRASAQRQALMRPPASDQNSIFRLKSPR